MSSPRIAVIDYGSGNLRSVSKALERSGLAPFITPDPSAVRGADAVVLPGVGAFADAISSLKSSGLADAVCDTLTARRPYLGLCLGLQVLFEEGDEHGITRGLSVLPGRVERFDAQGDDGVRLRVPHIGWNAVKFSGEHPMLSKLPAEDCFYFVHSYRAVPGRSADVLGRTDYGGEFAAAVGREDMFAVQFHPEKSQAAGHRLLDAFAYWIDEC